MPLTMLPRLRCDRWRRRRRICGRARRHAVRRRRGTACGLDGAVLPPLVGCTLYKREAVCVGRRPPRTARGDNNLFTAILAVVIVAAATRAVAVMAASAVATTRQRAAMAELAGGTASAGRFWAAGEAGQRAGRDGSGRHARMRVAVQQVCFYTQEYRRAGLLLRLDMALPFGGPAQGATRTIASHASPHMPREDREGGRCAASQGSKQNLGR